MGGYTPAMAGGMPGYTPGMRGYVPIIGGYMLPASIIAVIGETFGWMPGSVTGTSLVKALPPASDSDGYIIMPGYPAMPGGMAGDPGMPGRVARTSGCLGARPRVNSSTRVRLLGSGVPSSTRGAAGAALGAAGAAG